MPKLAHLARNACIVPRMRAVYPIRTRCATVAGEQDVAREQLLLQE